MVLLPACRMLELFVVHGQPNRLDTLIELRNHVFRFNAFFSAHGEEEQGLELSGQFRSLEQKLVSRQVNCCGFNAFSAEKSKV